MFGASQGGDMGEDLWPYFCKCTRFTLRIQVGSLVKIKFTFEELSG